MSNCVLNETNELTEKNVHLVITTICDRNCKYCCNKFYSMDDIPTVTDAELRKAENIFLTGGEPFAYGNPVAIAEKLKKQYSNIQKVIVYTNAWELYDYLNNKLTYSESIRFDKYIDGVNISIKNIVDAKVICKVLDNPRIFNLKCNRIYLFKDTFKWFTDEEWNNIISLPNTIIREWQTEFKPASDSIFRRI